MTKCKCGHEKSEHHNGVDFCCEIAEAGMYCQRDRHECDCQDFSPQEAVSGEAGQDLRDQVAMTTVLMNAPVEIQERLILGDARYIWDKAREHFATDWRTQAYIRLGVMRDKMPN